MEDSDSNILIRRSMHLISFTGYNINSTLGNFSNETALLTVDLNCEKSSQRGDYYLAYYDNNESITKSYFQMEKKYLIPTKSGVYTQSQVEDFTSLHHPFYNELEFDPYDLSDNTISCLDNEIWSPDFVNYDLGLKYTDSKVFTIQPGKSQCLYGNFVFNSKDDFIATVVYNDTKHYNVYTKQNAPKTILETYENPFTITTKIHDERLSQLIKLECKSKTEACKVQAVSVLPPIQKRLFMTPMKIESTFTTKTNFSIEKEITIDNDEIEIFSITVHNNKKFNVTVNSDNKEISNYLTTSNEFTTNEVSHNTVTIYPYYDLFKFIREEENLTTFKLKAKVKVQIVPSEENSTEEEGDEEIFENDLFLRLPSNGNGNSKEDVIEFNKKEEKLNRGLSGIILILAIILTIIVAVGVFIFIVYKVIEKKKKQSMKPTQEEIVSDDENEGEQHENISNSLDSNEI
ncbi:hypothetical protein TVAG_431920 [Trichomonas vaginalis G3]|uniref:Uncharacterized protein n=1 Tax=Trichomonas vaginalis (strain ATCC PRA-98 / G3) TaxID=412133 RepID=A2F7Y9_TRIV3|nr:glycoprotein 38 family [Trichomonas vaginalis G3]EAX98983.1 hypothetical protein TVAG_431920 [Trichomonas vaginalis G3]KAI5507239.1 glycoprotein 38 family [Trichomonas vaginalis G3]|eukprot:XP_001311913.1 hypothetical protein [Trichomonas vaginalis G3]